MERSCTSTGPMCTDCTHATTCIDIGNGEFNEITSQCSYGETCLNGQCTSNSNPPCQLPSMHFVCSSTGMYPDQMDCKKYHFCVYVNTRLEVITETCEGDYGYNAGTTYCMTALEQGVCFPNQNTYPVPICEWEGQSSYLMQNPTIYYVCQQYNANLDVLYPFLYKCPNGKVYNNYVCSPR